MSFKGKVTDISAESKMSKAGKPYSIWWTTLDDGTKANTGFKRPAYNVGDTIAFEAGVKYGKLEVDESTLVIGGGEAKPASSSDTKGKPATSGGYGKPFPLPKNHGDMCIIRQNALTNANTAVGHYFELHEKQEVLPEAPSTLEEYVEMVISTAYKFSEFSSGQREVKMVEDMRKLSGE